MAIKPNTQCIWINRRVKMSQNALVLGLIAIGIIDRRVKMSQMDE